MTSYQVVRTTTEKLQTELNRPGPHELFSVTYMGGRDWVVVTSSATTQAPPIAGGSRGVS